MVVWNANGGDAAEPTPKYTGVIAVASSTGNGYLGDAYPGSKVYEDAHASVSTGNLAPGSNFNKSTGPQAGGNGPCDNYQVVTSFTSCSLSVTWVSGSKTSSDTILYASDGSLRIVPTYSILGKDIVNENGMLTEKGMAMVLEAPTVEDPFYKITE